MPTYRSVVDWISANRAASLDVIRAYLGIGLFVRGLLFITESQGIETLVDLSTFSIASALITSYVTFVHLLGGLMLAVGLLTRLAALVQIPVLAGAVFLVHLQDGLLAPDQSFEFAALVLFLLVVVFIFGPGPWSADRYVFQQEPSLRETEPEKWWRDDDFESREALPTDGDRDTGEPVPAGVAAGSAAEAATKRTAAQKVGETTCSCGNDLSHPRVTAEPRYGWSAGFFFMLGISAPVKEVVFRCEKCGTVMKRTRDPEILREYRWHTS